MEALQIWPFSLAICAKMGKSDIPKHSFAPVRRGLVYRQGINVGHMTAKTRRRKGREIFVS